MSPFLADFVAEVGKEIGVAGRRLLECRGGPLLPLAPVGAAAVTL